jgi:glycosyltransferase involved in cell wall biosynthesis
LIVCYFGTYDRTYPRNAQVISALRRAGVDVVEQHVPLWEHRRDGWRAGAATAVAAAAAETRLLARHPPAADVLLVGYPGHLDVPVARRAADGRPVVFNPLVSLHDTLVGDRRRFRPRSPAARALALVDRKAFAAADLIVADTEAHARFFETLTETPVEVCYVGAEERVFRPGWAPREPFTVLFVGKLIPLQGVEVVLEAARMAPELRFRVVGGGQLRSLLEGRPPNVQHLAWVEYERLPAELRGAGCALGIFGTSPKAARVIPNKAFAALACGTPLVTGNTAAARELLVDGESALLVPPGDPRALAAAVRRLAADPQLATRLSGGGRSVYENRAGEDVLGRRWRALLERLVN